MNSNRRKFPHTSLQFFKPTVYSKVVDTNSMFPKQKIVMKFRITMELATFFPLSIPVDLMNGAFTSDLNEIHVGPFYFSYLTIAGRYPET